jgi:6-phosphogluconolactonase
MQPRIHYFANRVLLVEALCARIATLARSCLEQRGYFSIVLAGGATPRALYRQLRHLATDWQRWHIYFGDERFLPAGDPDRNDSMAAATWLDHVAIPAAQIHRVPTGDSVSTAAAAYASVLQQAPGFDLALLGLGEDGHTASLFPGDMSAHNSAQLAVAVTNAPKPPPQRVSMSPACLSMATAVWFIVTGDSKRPALQAWLAGAPQPPQVIRPHAGIDIFTDIES